MKTKSNELKHQISCVIREMSVEPEEQCDKIAKEIIGLLNTRPKPSVKWPERKGIVKRGELGGISGYNINQCEWCGTTAGKLHQSDCKRLVEDLKRIGRNQAIDACQAAVEAAGLKYGLDEESMAKFIARSGAEWELIKNPMSPLYLYIAHALKLAERELIVRKKSN